MRKLTKKEISDLEFDADLMGFRVVYIEKPLDENHFVLYKRQPQLTYVGHYRRMNDIQMAMQQTYAS